MVATGPMHGTKVGGHRIAQFQKYTPEQMELHKRQFGMVGPDSYLAKLAGGDPELMAQMEAPAMKQFGQMQGQIGSRFSGMGMGAQKSSGFRNTGNQAASDFAGQLQANRQQLQRQAIMDMMGISEQLLGHDPYETMMYERKHHGPNSPDKGAGWKGALGATIGGVGGFMVGGLPGAAAGAYKGYGIGSGQGGGGGGFNIPSSPDWDFGSWMLNNMPGGV